MNTTATRAKTDRRHTCFAHKIIFPTIVCYALFYNGSLWAALSTGSPLKEKDGAIKVVLIEPDIELLRTTAGGTREVRADWSESGKQHIEKWTKEYFQKGNLELSEFVLPDDEAFNRHRQLLALHKVVGFSILSHVLTPLATKKDSFDWTIGPGAALLSETSGADYGLFVFIRRGYATAGNIALSILAAAASGVYTQGSYQIGFASLIDLSDGHIVWFNNINVLNGDLRKEDKSENVVRALLADFPGLDVPKPTTFDTTPSGE